MVEGFSSFKRMCCVDLFSLATSDEQCVTSRAIDPACHSLLVTQHSLLLFSVSSFALVVASEREWPQGASRATFVGVSSGGGTPGPFSNPAVKPASADGTWNDSSWERRSSPTFFAQLSSPGPSCFVFVCLRTATFRLCDLKIAPKCLQLASFPAPEVNIRKNAIQFP